jgi:hypothetical protein
MSRNRDGQPSGDLVGSDLHLSIDCSTAAAHAQGAILGVCKEVLAMSSSTGVFDCHERFLLRNLVY